MKTMDNIARKNLEELVSSIECCVPNPPYYCVLGTMTQQALGISNKQVIDFFKDDGSVIVMDFKGRKWHKGKRVYDDGRDSDKEMR